MTVLYGKTAMELGSGTQYESEMKEAVETLFLWSRMAYHFIDILM